MNKKRHNLLVTLLLIYTIVIIYFMFFGFGRLQASSTILGYRFSIIPTRIPLWYPKELSLLWFFSLGNLLAFVPFGILIPMIFDTKYYKFIFVFLIFILSLEILQMITYLGSFDTEDIIINSIGATIGFLSYKISNKFKLVSQKTISTLFLILILSFTMINFAEIFNKFISYT
ncbi:VanZ family protein [Gottschalkia acidurici 9a]|uniref:VanZ family protein n=1 Tax=Gottschalkia acidurici (strain ATCC 7906 / DSM 604 / BCRC 14475 / CIP 104303 / KCTC 5404 / NCIMB 10678 / 9a) TaxID=1128398 RepID=K0B1N5_GOTA9|nr:VanZ family protein [Gottschalkia acidurici]AFS79012.1 VanZ family protein [Gottschalkia acidurici 9a]